MAWTTILLALGAHPLAYPQEVPPLEPFGPVPDPMTCEWLDVRVRGRIDLGPLGTGDQPVGLGEFDAAQWVRLFEQAGATSIHVTTTNFLGYRFWASDPSEPGVSALASGDGGVDPVQELHAACAAAGMAFGIEVAAAGAQVDQAVAGVREMLEGMPGIQYIVADPGSLVSRGSSRPTEATRRLGVEFPTLSLFERTPQGLSWCPETGIPSGESLGPREQPARGRHFEVAVGAPGVDQKVFDRIEDAWQVGGTCEVTVQANHGGAPADGTAALLEELGAMVRDRQRIDVLQAAVQRGGAEQNASNVRGASARYDAMQVLDPSRGKYWATDDGHRAASGLAWVEFQLAAPIIFDQVLLEEPSELGFRLQEYRLEAWVDGKWSTAHRGKLSGGRCEARFSEIRTRRVRLFIEAAAATPAISRLSLFRSPPSVAIDPPGTVSLNPVRVKLAARAGATVRYTVDGTDVHSGSPKYTEAILIKASTTVRARAFDGEGAALREAMAEIRIISPDEWRDAVQFIRAPEPGLSLETFEGNWQSLDQMGERLPATRSVVTGIDAGRDAPRREHAALRYTGHVLVPRDGLYTFTCKSDDGSRLRIHGELVVDNDGLHGMREVSGHVALRAGHHPIEISWFNARGPAGLEVRWSGPGVGRGALLSPDALFQ